MYTTYTLYPHLRSLPYLPSPQVPWRRLKVSPRGPKLVFLSGKHVVENHPKPSKCTETCREPGKSSKNIQNPKTTNWVQLVKVKSTGWPAFRIGKGPILGADCPWYGYTAIALLSDSGNSEATSTTKIGRLHQTRSIGFIIRSPGRHGDSHRAKKKTTHSCASTMETREVRLWKLMGLYQGNTSLWGASLSLKAGVNVSFCFHEILFLRLPGAISTFNQWVCSM